MVGNLFLGYGAALIPEQEYCFYKAAQTSRDEFMKSLRSVAALDEDGIITWACPAVLVIAFYNVPGDPLPRHTAKAGEIRNLDRGKHGFNGDKGTFSNIEIVKLFVSAQFT